jgi:hypothetical protein
MHTIKPTVLGHETSEIQAAQLRVSQFRLYPAFSIIAILASCLVAFIFIPEFDHHEHFALWIPALILSVGLLAGVLIAAVRSPASLLRTESILSFGLVYWITLDAIQGSYGLWGTSREAVETAFLGTALFAAAIWLGSAVPASMSRLNNTALSGDLSPALVFGVGLITFVAGILQPMLACNLSPGCFAKAFFMPWDTLPWRNFSLGEGGSGLNTLLKYVGFLGFLTLPLSAVLVRLEGRLSWRVILLWLLGMLILMLLIQSGDRRIVGMTIASTGLLWVLLRPDVRLRHLFRLAIIAAGLLLVLEAMVSWRAIGIGTGLMSGVPLVGKSKNTLSVDKHFYYMAHAMTIVPERHPYKPVEGLLFTLGAPIPRSVWPDKPAQRGINLSQLIGERKGPGFTWTCSAVGDFYLMGGLWVIAFGGLIFGILARACNQLLFQPLSARSRLLYAFSVMILFIGLRAIRDLTAIGLFVLFCLLFVLAMRRLFRKVVRYSTTTARAVPEIG